MGGLISIILPVYNREKYLEECLESVFNQTYQDLEVIIIDDGSKDDSLRISKRIAEEHSCVRVLESDHGGVSRARNMGLDVAKGEYVFFLDSDDIIHPCLLEVLEKGMREHGAGIGGTIAAGVREERWKDVSKRFLASKRDANISYQTYEESLYAVFCTECPLGNIGGVIIRRDLIGDTRFSTELFIGEDFWFIYQNLIKGTGTVFVDKKWYCSRLHANNSSWDWAFEGFYTRFYRRELVWKSEEAHGRLEYAKRQKIQAFSIWRDCIRRNTPYGTESKKIRMFMKKYKKILFPVLSFKHKVQYYLFAYFPFVSKIICSQIVYKNNTIKQVYLLTKKK